MNSFMELLKSKDIIISLRNYGSQDLSVGWEVKTIFENQGVFDGLYTRYPLTGILNLDDYYLYLLSLKFVGMREVIPKLLQKDHQTFIASISDDAQKTIDQIKVGDVIKYINTNIKDIFNSEESTHDLRFVTLELIAKYIDGIEKNVFEFLCNDYGYLMIDRFDKFERIFERYPDLFDSIYPTGHLEEINAFRLEKTLEIWKYLLKKEKSNLSVSVERRVKVLAEDIKELSDSATIDNIMQVEGTIREFHLFLQRIQSPKANEFANYAKKAAELLSKNISERGNIFKYEIPVEEIVNRWKKTEDWELRLLSLTHSFRIDDGIITCTSQLSNGPERKHPLLDFVRTNIPTDDYYTVSHQQTLSIAAGVGAGAMTGIIRNQETLIDYLNLVASAVKVIGDYLNADGEQLQKDVDVLAGLVQLVSINLDNDNDALRGLCYGAAMYICAFSEKLLRTLYLQLVKDEKYIPINKATFGELLVVSNPHIREIFGDNHIKNLSFYLQRTAPSNVGQNIRNSLAHLANISSSALTSFFVAKMLWIFTDILNTVFWYCLKDDIENENKD